jgi:hypothetical protein
VKLSVFVWSLTHFSGLLLFAAVSRQEGRQGKTDLARSIPDVYRHDGG